MTRTKTGISGLDELIDGGLVEGSTTLVSGGTGSGKTIFALQFCIMELQNTRNLVYMSLLKHDQKISKSKPRNLVGT